VVKGVVILVSIGFASLERAHEPAGEGTESRGGDAVDGTGEAA
jgi:hypothetical protein